VSNAEALACDTALGAPTFAKIGPRPAAAALPVRCGDWLRQVARQ
jgi:hypothetical protein